MKRKTPKLSGDAIFQFEVESAQRKLERLGAVVLWPEHDPPEGIGDRRPITLIRRAFREREQGRLPL